MKILTISALATALALGLIAPAQADEWTGLHLTFGLSGSSTALRDRQGFDEFAGTESQGDDSIAAYAAVGYDWAYDSFTIGVVGDVDLGQVDADLVNAGKGVYGETDWFATLRARVGVPVNDALYVYASGGLAMTRLSVVNSDGISGGSENLNGAAVGLGAEYALSPGRHLSIEYLYADFEKSDDYFESTPFGGTFNPTVSALRIGYTLRF